MKLKLLILILLLATVGVVQAQSKMVVLECSWKGDHPQSLMINYTASTAELSTFGPKKAAITEQAITWSNGVGNKLTLNRYSGVLAWQNEDGSPSSSIPAKCDIAATRKF